MIRPFAKLLSAAALLAATPSIVPAQIFPIGGHHCCPSCQQVECCCEQTRPVVETRFRPEQYTTYRNVTEMRTERQQVMETVPVTAYRQVQVDKGQYQMVWVPKMVTECVPETRFEQRVSYRDIQRPITRQVAETHTRMVPYQTVHMQTQQFRTVMAAPAPCATCLPSGAAPILGMAPPMAPAMTFAPSMPAAPYAPPSTASSYSLPPIPQSTAVPQSAGIPSMPAITVTPGGSRSATELTTIEPIVPEADELDLPPADYPAAEKNSWTPIESRNPGSDSRQSAYDEVPYRTSNAAGRFVPAPSAATVWQARGMFR